MPLIDLRRPAPEETVALDESDYPWGLELTLDQETLEKLGLSISDFEVGAEWPASVVFKVTGLSMNDSEHGKRESLSLVLAKVDRPSSESERADRLFGE